MGKKYESAWTYDCVRCAECGRVVKGRIPREGRLMGDGTVLMPRRHKPPRAAAVRDTGVGDFLEFPPGDGPRTYDGGWCFGRKLEAEDAPRDERRDRRSVIDH